MNHTPDLTEPGTHDSSALPDFIAKSRQRAARGLMRLASALEARPALAFLLLVLVYVPGVLGRSLDKPLWHDELFTYYIAQAPGISSVLNITHQIDLNPPLSYLLTKVSFAFFGVNTLTCRLPEMLGFLLAMLCLFLFVKRRAGTLYGLLAATLLYVGFAGALAGEARPYGLLLGFGSLSLLGWQKVRARDRLSLPFLLLGGFGMLLSHIFGLFVWMALGAGEVVRIVRRRQIDWKPTIAWLLVLLAAVTYAPMFRSHEASIFPQAFQPTLRSVRDFYTTWSGVEATSLLLAGFMMALIGWQPRGDQEPKILSMEESVSILLLLAVPCGLILQLMRSHAAFFPRYGTVGNIGVAVFFAALLAKWSRRDLGFALMSILMALLVTGQLKFALGSLVHKPLFRVADPKIPACDVCNLTQRLNPEIPFVDASGLSFVEMNYRQDRAMMPRLFYLTDPAASTTIAHANIFEGMELEKALLGLQANASAYADFIQQHRHFFVYGSVDYPEDWLLKKLILDGATIQLIGPASVSYPQLDLFSVRFDDSMKKTL